LPFPPLEDKAGESPRLYLPPEPDTLRLLRELTDGLLAAELVTSDDTSSLAVPTDVTNNFISFLVCYLTTRTTASDQSNSPP